MKLTIVAATGGIGRQLLAQSLAAGHEVTAVVRNPSRLDVDVKAVAVDLSDVNGQSEALRSAVQGADAVLSGLGARTKTDYGVATRGTRALIEAMDAVGTKRLVVVSAAPIGTVASPARPNPPRYDEGDGFVMRHVLNPMVKRVLRDHYADLATMEDEVRASRLDWTIIRPPQLTDKPLTGAYRTAYGQNLRGGTKISRADVADLMLRSLTMPESGHAVMALAY
ncbi:NAD(P)-dependent oxidoreductase [Streptacidiphilus jiangxiensis]|uniref:Putative NADH-flavin reductase n=1 Tax=Streptacidiphilus jiangxiensis TaxID=235985 RepID=A0A1H7UTT2_STRJI|nr:NAD(P)-binding oxidoreductase [Streptacidiphilus jiangxiensis]SEL99847.1 Putative NADH-flavin reductase [Streptacidiphilus jiangxiensis]